MRRKAHAGFLGGGGAAMRHRYPTGGRCFYLLESQLECWLLNARHMRVVPGRKTDMSDAEWICDLVAHGLVRPSFVPPAPIRRLRDLTRRRSTLLAERTRERQRMESSSKTPG
jgi:transposase